MANITHEFEFKAEQIKGQLKRISPLSKQEADQLANTIKKNLEESTGTLIAVSDKSITAFQLNVGLAFDCQVEEAFKNADTIFMAKENNSNAFSAQVGRVSFEAARKKANELKLPATKGTVQNLIRHQMGQVAVNKFTIHQYKRQFLKKGNLVMAEFIQKAINDHAFI